VFPIKKLEEGNYLPLHQYGMDIEKRPRLVKAGAQLLISDFSQYQKLALLLFKRK
jgi:hypothetical protein